MTQVKVSLPDQTHNEITRLVEQGEFINQDQAVEELLKRGLTAYGPTDDSGAEIDETMFGQRATDQQDPALQDDDSADEYTF